MLTVTEPWTGPTPLASLVTGRVTLGSAADFSQLAPSSVVTYTSTVPSPEGPNFPTAKPSLTCRLLTICNGGRGPRVGIWVVAEPIVEWAAAGEETAVPGTVWSGGGGGGVPELPELPGGAAVMPPT